MLISYQLEMNKSLFYNKLDINLAISQKTL